PPLDGRHDFRRREPALEQGLLCGWPEREELARSRPLGLWPRRGRGGLRRCRRHGLRRRFWLRFRLGACFGRGLLGGLLRSRFLTRGNLLKAAFREGASLIIDVFG